MTAADLLRRAAGKLRDKVVVDAHGCWIWQRSKTIHGYGKVKLQRRDVGAHVYAYRLAYGEVPDGLQIDHLCRVRACVNPEHLEAVTASENMRRRHAAEGAYDDCPEHGPKVFDARGVIQCRGCRTNRARIRNAAKRGTEPPRHGTRSSYGVYKCRCAMCVAAQHAYAARAVLREPEEADRG